MPKILINPGHGPGNANQGPTGYFEYIGMWKLSNYLKAELEKRGVVADLTRTEGEYPSITTRGAMAQGYDIYISEHSNAGGGGTARGCEIYMSLRRDDRVHSAALALAASKVMGNPNRGVKTKAYSTTQPTLDWYGEIRAAAATDCKHIFLAESGFHDNLLDEAWLKQDSNLLKLAQAQALEIFKILGVPERNDDAVTKYVIVQPGESMYRIHKNNGVALADLQTWNAHVTDMSLVHVGDMIYLAQPNTLEARFAALTREVILLKKVDPAQITILESQVDMLKINLNACHNKSVILETDCRDMAAKIIEASPVAQKYK